MHFLLKTHYFYELDRGGELLIPLPANGAKFKCSTSGGSNGSGSLFTNERLAFAAAVAAASNATGSFTGLADYLWPLGQSPVPGGHQLPMSGYPLFWQPKKPILGSAMPFGE